ncbi:MAG: MtnX-like HAD-IB family phosphatase [bacterium]
MKTVYFVDFDNTVSLIDVWDNIVARFAEGNWEEVIRDYEARRISSQEFNERLLRALHAEPEAVRSFILGVDLDPAFGRFVKLARDHERELILVSDGYDFYIEPLMEKAGMKEIPYFCNHLEWVNGSARWSFPYLLPDCEQKMANCKCQHLRLNEPELRRVYIGDGVSDICAAEKADIVYAKSDLRRYFQTKKLPFTPFETFEDIIPQEFPQSNQ